MADRAQGNEANSEASQRPDMPRLARPIAIHPIDNSDFHRALHDQSLRLLAPPATLEMHEGQGVSQDAPRNINHPDARLVNLNNHVAILNGWVRNLETQLRNQAVGDHSECIRALDQAQNKIRELETAQVDQRATSQRQAETNQEHAERINRQTARITVLEGENLALQRAYQALKTSQGMDRRHLATQGSQLEILRMENQEKTTLIEDLRERIRTLGEVNDRMILDHAAELEAKEDQLTQIQLENQSQEDVNSRQALRLAELEANNLALQRARGMDRRHFVAQAKKMEEKHRNNALTIRHLLARIEESERTVQELQTSSQNLANQHNITIGAKDIEMEQIRLERDSQINTLEGRIRELEGKMERVRLNNKLEAEESANETKILNDKIQDLEQANQDKTVQIQDLTSQCLEIEKNNLMLRNGRGMDRRQMMDQGAKIEKMNAEVGKLQKNEKHLEEFIKNKDVELKDLNASFGLLQFWYEESLQEIAILEEKIQKRDGKIEKLEEEVGAMMTAEAALSDAIFELESTVEDQQTGWDKQKEELDKVTSQKTLFQLKLQEYHQMHIGLSNLPGLFDTSEQPSTSSAPTQPSNAEPSAEPTSTSGRRGRPGRLNSGSETPANIGKQ